MTGKDTFVVLCTDFGSEGPYVGQMKAVVCQRAPRARLIELFSDLPPFNAKAAAYLLPAYRAAFPPGTVFLCVVDPGVGSERRPLVVKADEHFFVGPDNGLFAMIVRRARALGCWRITWMPERLSSSFHGRDLFAPVAALLACGEAPPGDPVPPPRYRPPEWPDELAEVVYIDRFGNAMIGMRAAALSPAQTLVVKGREIAHGATFSAVPIRAPFWYENANGLLEVAVNRGRADRELGLALGDRIEVKDE